MPRPHVGLSRLHCSLPWAVEVEYPATARSRKVIRHRDVHAFPVQFPGLVFNQLQKASPEPAGLVDPTGALALFHFEEAATAPGTPRRDEPARELAARALQTQIQGAPFPAGIEELQRHSH